jgi:hypothetical protein
MAYLTCDLYVLFSAAGGAREKNWEMGIALPPPHKMGDFLQLFFNANGSYAATPNSCNKQMQLPTEKKSVHANPSRPNIKSEPITKLENRRTYPIIFGHDELIIAFHFVFKPNAATDTKKCERQHVFLSLGLFPYTPSQKEWRFKIQNLSPKE